MSKYLIFDTETTSPKPGCRVVELALILADDVAETTEKFESLVDYMALGGIEIPQGASDVHGIYIEDLIKDGMPAKLVLRTFLDFVKRTDYIVAHNISFDIAAMLTLAKELGDDYVELFKRLVESKILVDTMEMTRDIVKIPPTEKMVAAGFTNYKNPKVEELYEYLFEEEMTGAHRAMPDVKALTRSFFELKRRYD